MSKYFIFLSFMIGSLSFSMDYNRSFAAIDPASILTITKQVVTNTRRTKSREIYCADLTTRQQLIAMKTTSGSASEVCCDLNIRNGPCLTAMPVDDRYFEVLKIRYHQMKANSK